MYILHDIAEWCFKVIAHTMLGNQFAKQDDLLPSVSRVKLHVHSS